VDRTLVADDYSRFSQLAFVLCRDPVAAEVIAVDAVLIAVRRTLTPDGPPGIQRAKRKLAVQAIGYTRRRRIRDRLPWSKPRPDGVQLPERARAVWDAVGELSPRQQVAVVMARLDGATLAEIADVLECSTAAAQAHLERARKSLVERFGDEGDLRGVLTRELQVVAHAYVRDHRPDAAPAVQAMRRSGRWRAWGLGIGVVAAGVAVTLVNMFRS
jgi:DNA-directed RNA polymerase specialized sigma24 family protein